MTDAERWPHLTRHKMTACWWCDDCVKCGPIVYLAAAELDAAEADYAKHCASSEHAAKANR